MDRKSAIAVGIALLVMFVWQYKFAPKYVPPAAPAASPTPSAAEPAVPSAIAPAPTPSANDVAEALQEASSPSVNYLFTNLGGGIARAVLLKHTSEADKNVTLNEFGTLPIGAISEHAGEAVTEAYSVKPDATNGQVICERTDARGVQIIKKFTLPKSAKDTEEYAVKLDVTFVNHGAQPFPSNGYFVYAGSASPIHQLDLTTYTGFDFYRNGSAKYIDTTWFSAATIPLLGIERRPERPVYSETLDHIAWAAVKGQYFTTIIAPEEAKGNAVWARRFQFDFTERMTGTVDLQKRGAKGSPYAIEGALGMPGFRLQPGETHNESFSIYAGPTVYNVLHKLGRDQDEVLNFGTFKIVSKFLLNSMNWLHSVLGSYAAAIIVLTLCIKSALWPLQNRATASMKKMQALQPRMTELREKYKDDPTRMNEELMKLYKQYGVNPFGGCLPMFVQIPIFFGFYRMLGTAIELRNSRFLWVPDLSQSYTSFHLGPIPVNILPLCMAATMLWQMSLSPKSGDAMQQKMFMFVPLIFILFCYNYASALALYWTVQNLFSVVQLYVTRSQTAPALAKVTTTRKKKP